MAVELFVEKHIHIHIVSTDLFIVILYDCRLGSPKTSRKDENSMFFKCLETLMDAAAVIRLGVLNMRPSILVKNETILSVAASNCNYTSWNDIQ